MKASTARRLVMKGVARGLQNSANFPTGVHFYLGKTDLYHA